MMKLVLLLYQKELSLAIINNQTFPFSKWWFSSAIELLSTNPSCFSKKNISQSMATLIAGSNVVGAIKEWLFAAAIIEPGAKQTYRLTNFGEAIRRYDPQLNNSGTWWAIHFALAFSEKAETYTLYFTEIEQQTGLVIDTKKLLDNITKKLEHRCAKASIEKSFQGVNKLFDKNFPLDELGLIEKGDKGRSIRLGKPELNHDIVMHAIVMTKFQLFPSRESVSFTKFCETSNLHKFLCISIQELRDTLVEMSLSNQYSKYFSFGIAVDIESLTFSNDISPQVTMLRLIQSKEETWK